MKKKLKQFIEEWLFSVGTSRALSLFRIATAALILFNTAAYALNYDTWGISSDFYSTFSRNEIFGGIEQFSLFNYFFGRIGFAFCMSLHFIPAGLLLLGIGGRFTSILSLLAYCSLANANPALAYGFDEYIILNLITLIVHPGMDHYVLRPNRVTENIDAYLSTFAIRVFQNIFIIRYASAGWFKFVHLEGNEQLVWNILNVHELAKFDVGFMHEFLFVFTVLSFAVMLFEMIFGIFVLLPQTRTFALVFGIVMHLSIGLSTSLLTFSFAMLSGYFLFLREVQPFSALNVKNPKPPEPSHKAPGAQVLVGS